MQTTPGGLLRFRFRALIPGVGPRYLSEATALPDTPANRARVKRQAELIGAELRLGVFDYLKWFPNGNRAALFLAARGGPPNAASTTRWTVRGYYGAWIERKTPPLVRASAERDYRCHFSNYILDALGDVLMAELSLGHLEDLRTALRKRELSDKSIRNVIDGSLRAMFRDAADEEIPVGFPFPKLRWPERIVPGPSPFNAEERDRLLAYFRAKRWKFGGFNDSRPHYAYFAFLYTLFFTGMRPSETAALRLHSVNLEARTIYVERSRHLGTEAPPKTQRARRTVRLTPGAADVLTPLVALEAAADDHLFLNIHGEPIEQANFYDLFRDAQRALTMTPLRDLYSTKDTYISLALTNGVSLPWLSEQTGVAVATILKHYGRFIHSTQADDLELSKIGDSSASPPPNSAEFEHRFEHREGPEKPTPRISKKRKASPTGFEPVLPT